MLNKHEHHHKVVILIGKLFPKAQSLQVQGVSAKTHVEFNGCSDDGKFVKIINFLSFKK